MAFPTLTNPLSGTLAPNTYNPLGSLASPSKGTGLLQSAIGMSPQPYKPQMSVAPVGVKAKAPSTATPVSSPTLSKTMAAPQAAPLATGNASGVVPQGNPNFSGVTTDGSYGTMNGGAPAPQQVAQPQAPQTPAAPVQSAQPAQPQQPSTYSGIIQQLLNLSQNGSAGVDKARQDLLNFNNQLAGANANIETTPIPLEFQQGREQVLARQASSQQANYQGALTNALQSQQQQLSGLGTAAGLAAPIQAPYTNQVLNPQTGENIQGGTSGNPITNSIPSLVQSVVNGQMSPSQALSQLGNNPAFSAQLYQAILQQNPNFNFNQAEQNKGVQGQLGPAIQRASTLLQNLKTTLTGAGGLLNTSSPGVNSAATSIAGATGIGAGSAQGLTAAITEARTAMSNALGLANNSTPSAYDAYVKSLIPDGVSPQQLEQAISQFQTAVQAGQAAYSSPGTVGTQTTTPSGGGQFSW